VSHAAQHPVHTLQTEAHIATAQHNFNDVFLLIISTNNVNLAMFRRMLPDDGPNGPKHVEAIQRDILSVSCSILCFNKGWICWQKRFELIKMRGKTTSKIKEVAVYVRNKTKHIIMAQ
jgi:hypothetical protein